MMTTEIIGIYLRITHILTIVLIKHLSLLTRVEFARRRREYATEKRKEKMIRRIEIDAID